MDRNSPKAPAPPREGLARRIYFVVQDLGGATFDAVKRYLLTDPDAAEISDEKLKTSLGNCVYRGYLIREGKTYHVAPLSYYQAKSEKWRASLRKTYEKKRAGKPLGRKGRPPKDGSLTSVQNAFEDLVSAKAAYDKCLKRFRELAAKVEL